MKYSRRSFLEFLGKGSVIGVASVTVMPLISACKQKEATQVDLPYAAKINFNSIYCWC